MMRFRVEPTGVLPSREGGYAPRYAIINDADVEVCRTEFRTWADHICALLNTFGEDREPTPEQAQQEWARDARIRRNREEAEAES